MSSIEITVNKQLNGFTFAIMPSMRELIRKLSPGSQPANTIFVSYDVQSDFESNISQLENYIFPALLGIKNLKDLEQINEIEFIDPHTRNVLHSVNPKNIH